MQTSESERKHHTLCRKHRSKRRPLLGVQLPKCSLGLFVSLLHCSPATYDFHEVPLAESTSAPQATPTPVGALQANAPSTSSLAFQAKLLEVPSKPLATAPPATQATTSALPPLQPVTPSASSVPRCGNRIQESNEECDGTPQCGANCKLASCGNQRVDDGEECDPPISGSCTSTCNAVRCGNQRLEAGEECDPPLTGSCSAQCLIEVCGNSRLDGKEECEPPSVGTCSATCSKIQCGNGRLDPGEGCEPPSTALCDASCRAVGCGNQRLDSGEECDPPLSGSCDGRCRKVQCGNARIDEGEECDPPQSGKCDSKCHNISCGNSRIDEGEKCDPPQTGKCSSTCQTIACGDGRLDPGEQCEPKLASAGTCSDKCQSVTTGGGTVLHSFDSNEQGWSVISAAPTRLKDVSSMKFDAQNGDTTPGCLRIDAPFDGSNQKVEFQVNLSPELNLSGRTLRVKVRLKSGLSSDSVNPGGIKLYAKSGENWDYASGDWAMLTTGSSWVEATLMGDKPVLSPAKFDATKVRQIGLELRTFDATQSVSAAIVYVDSVSVQ